jgi:hypothetical protein
MGAPALAKLAPGLLKFLGGGGGGDSKSGGKGFGLSNALGTALGGAQIIGGLLQQRKGRKETEKLINNMPKELEDQGILDLAARAQQRAATSPTNMAFYKRQMQNIDRGAATGIRGLQNLGRGAALAGTSTIARDIAGNKLKAEEAAEGVQERRESAFGSATQMKAGEKRRVFDLNVRQPWRMKTQMAMQRAAAGGQIANLGSQNMMRALMDVQRGKAYQSDDV